MSAAMQGDWRLVNKKELYDLSKDPGQKNDIAQANPAKVDELRKAYQAWWPAISQHGNDFNRVVVGSKNQAVVCLTAHDFFALDDNPAWNQDLIRQAKGGNGPWKIEVAEAGRYRVSLRRYPLESKLALDAAAPIPSAEPGVNPYPPGEALAIRNAKLLVGTEENEVAVKPGSQSADFVVDLPVGDAVLQTLLIDEQGKEYGAFYAYISKLR